MQPSKALRRALATVAAAMVVSMGWNPLAAQDKPQPPPGAAQATAIQGANILDIKPDASATPGYAKETAAQRAQSQPGNNAPIWRDVRSGIAGSSTLPAPESGVLIQASGEWWRTVRNSQITVYGGWFLLAVLGLIAAFYAYRGPIKLTQPLTGRLIERFTPTDRQLHWTLAISFCVLAVSGLVMLFGKYFLLPVLGATLFGWLSYALKNLHNFIGPIFALVLIVVVVRWVRYNLPAAHDLAWLLKGGGLLTGAHVPSHRFNAGEKIWFWLGVFALGLVVSASGFVLNKIVPGIDYTRGTMQLAHIVHAVATLAMMGFAAGHIYIGSIGTEGALDGMKTGYVDETWAKEHHELWYDDIVAGKIPARTVTDGESAMSSHGVKPAVVPGGE